MRFLNGFLIPVLALAISPILSAPILPNVNSLEARSIEDGSLNKRFTPAPHQHSSSLETRGFAPPPLLDEHGYPRPPSTNPKPVANVETNVSKRGTGSEAPKPDGHNRVTGRIVGLGKKLARLFYHPIHKHFKVTQPKSHEQSQSEGVDGEADEA